VAKKVVAAATSVSSTKAFPTAGLALQLEVPIAAAASIPGRKVGEECWNSSLDGWLEVVPASILLEAAVADTLETLPMASQVLDPYENHVIWKFDLWMGKNLNSELKKRKRVIPMIHRSVGSRDRQVCWDADCMGRGM
jgi:hypothetical protein